MMPLESSSKAQRQNLWGNGFLSVYFRCEHNQHTQRGWSNVNSLVHHEIMALARTCILWLLWEMSLQKETVWHGDGLLLAVWNITSRDGERGNFDILLREAERVLYQIIPSNRKVISDWLKIETLRDIDIISISWNVTYAHLISHENPLPSLFTEILDTWANTEFNIQVLETLQRTRLKIYSWEAGVQLGGFVVLGFCCLIDIISYHWSVICT